MSSLCASGEAVNEVEHYGEKGFTVVAAEKAQAEFLRDLSVRRISGSKEAPRQARRLWL